MITFATNNENMIPGRKLIKVGTSHALIIPAKTMKKKGYTPDTLFDIDDEGEDLIIRAIPQRPKLVLPKIKGPIKIDPDYEAIMGTVSYTKEEIEADPILKAILGV